MQTARESATKSRLFRWTKAQLVFEPFVLTNLASFGMTSTGLGETVWFHDGFLSDLIS
jgi:hypothetical protein